MAADHAGEAGSDRVPADRMRWVLRLVLALSIVVVAASLAFVLVFATDLPWIAAVLISILLAGAQTYGLRRTLFRSDGNSSTHP